MFMLGNECKVSEKADAGIINNFEKAESLCNKQRGFTEVFQAYEIFLGQCYINTYLIKEDY